MNEIQRLQQLAGIITEIKVNNPTLKIKQFKYEALEVLEEFIEEFEDQDLFEYIPDLDDYYIDKDDNSLTVEELATIYLIQNEIPLEVQEIMKDSQDGVINQEGSTWKKYPKSGYYYIVVS